MVPESSGFFVEGEATDPSYQHLRDSRCDRSRCGVEELWEQYRNFADPHFREDARNHFHQRYWEMYLGVALMNRGFQLQRWGDAGPDFYIEIGKQRIWLEAVAPERGCGDDEVPSLVLNKVMDVPVKQMILRFTQALREKRGKYLGALKKGIIAPEDQYILAINSYCFMDSSFQNPLPVFLKAFMGVGDRVVNLPRRSSTSSEFTFRTHVTKTNDAEVSTVPLLDKANAFCSAVLHSRVNAGNRRESMDGDFQLLLNPHAQSPVRRQEFAWWERFVFDGSFLQRIPPGAVR